MEKQNAPDREENFSKERRKILKLAIPLATLIATPAYATNLFDLLNPKSKKDKEKQKKTFEILEGAGKILSSTAEMDYKTEFSVGEQLALEGFKRFGLPVKDRKLQEYVNLVGNAVVANSSRPNIPYYFVAVSSDVYNAFACPGGIVFVSSALIGAMKDESELAGVLAHEVAHVGHKHALDSLKRSRFFKGVSQITAATTKKDRVKQYKEMIGGLQTVLFDKGLDKNMEFEADATGMQTAYRTGYDPDGLTRVLEMLRSKEKGAVKKGSWFSTHPPLSDRIIKCSRLSKNYPDGSGMAKVKKRFEKNRKRLN